MKINEKNLCIFATTPPYDLEGFLNKRGEVNKAWQKRYFVLKGNLLFYFEKKGDKDPLGLIIVEGCTIELSEEDSDQFTFQIVFNGNRTYVLSAETQTAMELWMKALTCAGYEYKKLMVAELQLQLNEFNKRRDENNLPITPKPPPRRQNPFNRPAPPPPIQSNVAVSTTANLGKVTGYQHIPSATSTVELGSSSTSISGDTVFYGNLIRTDCAVPKAANNLGKSANQFNPKAEFSFKVSHEAFREVVYKDVNNYRAKIDTRTKPLIDF